MDDDSVLSEHSLAERIRQGDSAAEEEFVERFHRRALVMATVRTGDPQVAADLAQEAMLGVLTALREGRVNDHQHLAGYVYGTTRNLVNNYFRRRDPTTTPITEATRAADDPELAAERSERLGMVERALEEMGPDDREVLRLTLVDGLKPGEIADRLGLTSEVVRKRKSRAVSRLQKIVREWSQNPAAGHIDSEDR
jgi:RNA polymerase sigma-70 factor (ECF subfamily)